ALPVRLSCPLPAAVTVDYATASGTAIAGSDFTAASGTLNFAPGDVTRLVPLTVLSGAARQDTAFSVQLANPRGPAGLSAAVAVVPRGTVRILTQPFCARPPEFWRDQRGSWAVDSLTLGGVASSESALLDLLRYLGSDPLFTLARNLAATRFNLAAGADASIRPTADQADAFLAQHPLGGTVAGAALTQAQSLASSLAAAYNRACPLACVPQPLGTAGGFNLFVLGNLTQSGSDTEGRMAVGGNATLASYSVGARLTGASDVLVVGGNLS